MTDTELKKPSKAAAHKVNFAKNPLLFGAFKGTGRITDTNPTSLQLRVSSTKAVWYYRFRTSKHVLVERTLEFRAVAVDGDGKLTLDYQQAKAMVAKIKLDAEKTDAEIHADDYKAQFRTLGSGFEYYLTHRKTKSDRSLAESTKSDYEKVFKQYLRTNILSKTAYPTPPSEWILDNTPVMQWKLLFEAIQKRSLAKALNCQSIVSGIYNLGCALEVLKANPISNVRAIRTLPGLAPKSNHVDTINLPRFFKAIDENLIREDAREAVLLLTMTGTRLLAALSMRWDQLNLDDGYYYVLPGQIGWKSFSGVLPLSDFVIELLKNRRHRRQSDASEYVFPAHRESRYPHQSTCKDALDAVSAEPNGRATAQDLRRTFATVCALCFNDNMRKVGALLTHKWAVSAEGMVVTKDAITRRYVQNELPSLRATANRAANFMLELTGRLPMSGRTSSILAENDPENLRLLNISEGSEERELQRLALEEYVRT